MTGGNWQTGEILGQVLRIGRRSGVIFQARRVWPQYTSLMSQPMTIRRMYLLRLNEVSREGYYLGPVIPGKYYASESLH